jgi:hypothetical protein
MGLVLYPRGLVPDATYAVRSIDIGPLGTARGDALMQDGLELTGNGVSRSHVLVLRVIEVAPEPGREP